MLFNFCWIPKRNNRSLLFISPLLPSLPRADALGGIMWEGCVPCRLPTAQGRVPPARVCMADCIKHKQLYLIGLYPALITTNSQSLRTALLARTTPQNKRAKSHSCVILQRERDDVSAGTTATLVIKQAVRFLQASSVMLTVMVRWWWKDAVIVMALLGGKSDLDLLIASAAWLLKIMSWAGFTHAVHNLRFFFFLSHDPTAAHVRMQYYKTGEKQYCTAPSHKN